jgi:hypothetical protein
MRSPTVLVALACALVAMALPAAAEAKSSYVVEPKGLHLRVGLPENHGYSISLDTKGHRQVTMSVSKDRSFVRYTALGKVTRKGIEADFGSFGQVSLRFRSKSRFDPRYIPGLRLPGPLRTDCKGRKPIGEKGVFLGNLRFSGEHGYVEVKAHRRRGEVVRSYRRVCKRRSRAEASKAESGIEAAGLTAAARREGTLRFLIALGFSLSLEEEEESSTIAFGGLKEKVGRVAVDKLALIIDEFDSMRVSPVGEKPLSAEVKLPKPFEGTGSYLKEGKAPPIWSGDLGLRLPGSGLVPLTGPEFETDLCRATELARFERCLESLLEDSALLAQGSGSHSQPLALARLSSLR